MVFFRISKELKLTASVSAIEKEREKMSQLRRMVTHHSRLRSPFEFAAIESCFFAFWYHKISDYLARASWSYLRVSIGTSRIRNRFRIKNKTRDAYNTNPHILTKDEKRKYKSNRFKMTEQKNMPKGNHEHDATAERKWYQWNRQNMQHSPCISTLPLMAFLFGCCIMLMISLLHLDADSLVLLF